ncbi:hypothetical protein RYX36_025941 [Vicia faba]
MQPYVYQGDKVQASVRKALLLQFENKIKEGSSYNFKSFGVAANTGSFRTTKHQFKLNLQSGTIVTNVGTGVTTLSPYSFVSFTYIIGNIDMEYLICRNLKVGDSIGSPTQPFSYMKDASDMSLEDEFMNLGQCKTIEELKDCQDNSGGVEDDLAAGVVHNEVDAVVVQDMGKKFDNIAAEEKYGDNGSMSKLIEEDVAESTPVKRGVDEVVERTPAASETTYVNTGAIAAIDNDGCTFFSKHKQPPLSNSCTPIS